MQSPKGGGKGSLTPWSPEIFAAEPREPMISMPGNMGITVKPGAPNEMLWSPGAPIVLPWSPRAPYILDRSLGALNPFETLFMETRK